MGWVSLSLSGLCLSLSLSLSVSLPLSSRYSYYFLLLGAIRAGLRDGVDGWVGILHTTCSIIVWRCLFAFLVWGDPRFGGRAWGGWVVLLCFMLGVS